MHKISVSNVHAIKSARQRRFWEHKLEIEEASANSLCMCYARESSVWQRANAGEMFIYRTRAQRETVGVTWRPITRKTLLGNFQNGRVFKRERIEKWDYAKTMTCETKMRTSQETFLNSRSRSKKPASSADTHTNRSPGWSALPSFQFLRCHSLLSMHIASRAECMLLGRAVGRIICFISPNLSCVCSVWTPRLETTEIPRKFFRLYSCLCMIFIFLLLFYSVD